MPNSNLHKITGKNPLLINIVYISIAYEIAITIVHYLISMLPCGINYAISTGKLEKSKPFEKVRKATILNPGITDNGIRAAEQDQYLLDGCCWPLDE